MEQLAMDGWQPPVSCDAGESSVVPSPSMEP